MGSQEGGSGSGCAFYTIYKPRATPHENILRICRLDRKPCTVTVPVTALLDWHSDDLKMISHDAVKCHFEVDEGHVVLCPAFPPYQDHRIHFETFSSSCPMALDVPRFLLNACCVEFRRLSSVLERRVCSNLVKMLNAFDCTTIVR